MNANTLNSLKKLVAQHAAALGTDYKKTERWSTDAASALADTIPGFATAFETMNQKAKMRSVQALAFTASGDLSCYDNVTAAIAGIVLLTSESQVTFENVRFACSGTGNEDSRLPKGVMGARLRKVFGLTKRGTIESKTSRTVGKNGLFTALGITARGDSHSFEIRDRAHPFLIAYAVALSKISDSAFNVLNEKLNK